MPFLNLKQFYKSYTSKLTDGFSNVLVCFYRINISDTYKYMCENNKNTINFIIETTI